MSNNDEMRRIFSSLHSLRQNLPDEHTNSTVDWEEVNEHNSLLDRLENTGLEISEFRLPQSMLVDEYIQTNYLSGATEPSGKSSVRLGMLKMKIDSLLTYFSLEDKDVQFGFHDRDDE